MERRNSAQQRVPDRRAGGSAWLDLALKILIAGCLYAIPLVVCWRLGLSTPWATLTAAGLSAGAATVLGLVFGPPAIAGVGAGHLVADLLVPHPMTPSGLFEALAATIAVGLALFVLVRLRSDRDDPYVPDIPAVLIFVAVFSLAETSVLLFGMFVGLESADIRLLALRLPAAASGALVLILLLNLVTSLVLRLFRRRRG